jgi:hypothetical protein
MRSLYDIGADELRWVKPRWWKRRYELRAGDEVVATLARSGGSGAIGEWSSGRYRFFQKGWFRPRVLVSSDPLGDTDTPLATYTGRDGALTFADGRVFFWRKPGKWRSKRVWMDSAATLIAFDPASGYTPAQVTIASEGARLAELPLLLLLGEYLIVRAREDADAASAATTTAIIAST